MQAWKLVMSRMLRWALFEPQTEWELFVLTALAVLTFLFFLTKAADAFRFPGRGLGLSGGVLLAIVAGAAVLSVLRVSFPACVRFDPAYPWYFLAAWAVVLLVIVVPACRLLFRGNYLQSLASVAVALVAAALLILFTRAVFQFARGGATVVTRSRDRVDIFRDETSP